MPEYLPPSFPCPPLRRAGGGLPAPLSPSLRTPSPFAHFATPMKKEPPETPFSPASECLLVRNCPSLGRGSLYALVRFACFLVLARIFPRIGPHIPLCWSGRGGGVLWVTVINQPSGVRSASCRSSARRAVGALLWFASNQGDCRYTVASSVHTCAHGVCICMKPRPGSRC